MRQGQQAWASQLGARAGAEGVCGRRLRPAALRLSQRGLNGLGRGGGALGQVPHLRSAAAGSSSTQREVGGEVAERGNGGHARSAGFDVLCWLGTQPAFQPPTIAGPWLLAPWPPLLLSPPIPLCLPLILPRVHLSPPVLPPAHPPVSPESQKFPGAPPCSTKSIRMCIAKGGMAC